jgi:hypothetical protein
MIPGSYSVPFPKPYIAFGAFFDGSTPDFATRGAVLTGAADSKLFTLSCWVRNGANSVTSVVTAGLSALAGTTARGMTFQINTNRALFIGRNSAGTNILNVNSSNSSLPASGTTWVHVLASFDMANAANRHLYLNDVSDLATVTTYTDDTLGFATNCLDWSLGAAGNGTTTCAADYADLWFKDGLYIDFSIDTNRRRFIGPDRRPVYLGPSGEYPTGSSPALFFSGHASQWATNKGTGGTFTLSGALTDSTRSPSK